MAVAPETATPATTAHRHVADQPIALLLWMMDMEQVHHLPIRIIRAAGCGRLRSLNRPVHPPGALAAGVQRPR
jgi:hypothetical protein